MNRASRTDHLQGANQSHCHTYTFQVQSNECLDGLSIRVSRWPKSAGSWSPVTRRHTYANMHTHTRKYQHLCALWCTLCTSITCANSWSLANIRHAMWPLQFVSYGYVLISAVEASGNYILAPVYARNTRGNGWDIACGQSQQQVQKEHPREGNHCGAGSHTHWTEDWCLLLSEWMSASAWRSSTSNRSLLPPALVVREIWLLGPVSLRMRAMPAHKHCEMVLTIRLVFGFWFVMPRRHTANPPITWGTNTSVHQVTQWVKWLSWVFTTQERKKETVAAH